MSVQVTLNILAWGAVDPSAKAAVGAALERFKEARSKK